MITLTHLSPRIAESPLWAVAMLDSLRGLLETGDGILQSQYQLVDIIVIGVRLLRTVSVVIGWRTHKANPQEPCPFHFSVSGIIPGSPKAVGGSVRSAELASSPCNRHETQRASKISIFEAGCTTEFREIFKSNNPGHPKSWRYYIPLDAMQAWDHLASTSISSSYLVPLSM